jgi:HlyD family secretion protein
MKTRAFLKAWPRRFGLPDGDADPDLSREAPHREVLIGSIIVGLLIVVLGIWAALARLDAGVVGKGQVVVAGSRQTVQHRDGGIVQSLNVHEGDHVRAGQVLLVLATDELKANARAIGNQVIEQKALQARLLAELKHASIISFPAEFNAYSGQDRAAADAARTLQQLEFSRRFSAIGASRSILQSQILESKAQIAGYERQVESTRAQASLVDQEIASLQSLYKSGLVPDSRIRALERSKAQISGDEGSGLASGARTREEIGEKLGRIASLVTERDADDAKEYRAAELQLAELEPKLAALDGQIDRATIRAPATGQVIGLTVFTLGGVVAPGQKLLDIVPSDAALVIEARVSPTEADDLHIGQAAEIRISAFHDRKLPRLHGVVSKLSADSFTDEKTGVPYFKIEVTVPPAELAHITDVRGADFGLRPGLPTDVVIPTTARTAFDYLFEPLGNALWRSFKEK